MTDAASRAAHENDTPPDLSQGYTPRTPARCPYKYNQIVRDDKGKPVTVSYHCELERRHTGDHRQGGVHWEGYGIGFRVEPDEGTDG